MFGLGSNSQMGIGIAIMLDDRFSGRAVKVNQQLIAMRKNASSAISGAMNSYRNNAATIAAGATAVSYGMLQAAKSGAEFEHRINQVAIVGGAALKRSRKDLAAYASNLSKEFTKNPTEIGAALFENVKAGVSGNIEEITRYQIATATAVEETLEGSQGVAEKLLGIMNAMDIAPTQFKRVANATTAAANATMASVYSIGESMQYAAFTAHTFNIPLEQTLALVGKLAQSKIVGSMAGTRINQMFTQLSKSLGPFITPKSEKAWKMLGLKPKAMENMVNSGNIFGVLQAVEQASSGMKAIDRKAALNTLFNVRGGAGVEGFFDSKNGNKTLSSIYAEIQQGVKDDIAIKQSKQMMQDLFSDFKFMANAFHRFRIAFTAAAGPFIRVAMGVGMKIMGWLSALVQTPVGKVLAGVAAAAAPIIAIMFAFRTAVLTAIIALRGFSASSISGGFGNLVGAGLGSLGMGRMAASGVTRNAAGRLTVAAGRTVNFAGKVYKGGQLLPGAFAASGGMGARILSGLGMGGAGAAAGSFFSKAGPWLGRIASFGGRMLPIVGWVWTIAETLKYMYNLEKGKVKERDETAEFIQAYNRNLDAMFLGKTSTDSWYKFNKTPFGGKFDPYKKDNKMQQQINIYVDGSKAAVQQVDTNFEDNLNSILNFNLNQ